MAEPGKNAAAPQEAASALVEQVREVARAETPEARGAALDRLAEMVRAGGGAAEVLPRLLRADGRAQHIALELTPRLTVPLPAASVEPLTRHLGREDLHLTLRMAVAVQLLRTLPRPGDAVHDVLAALTRGLTPGKALHRLEQLRDRVPRHEALEAAAAKLEAAVPMKCPRCDATDTRPGMVKHLWKEHGLMLDGQRAREPWGLVRSWLKEYAATGEAELLSRAGELAEQLDPQGGLVQVRRELLAAGADDPDARESLAAEARRRHASLCPQCYAVVPVPITPPTPAMTASRGRVAGLGYSVEVFDRTLRSRLTADAPAGRVYDGREPGRRLTRHGWNFAFAGPFVVAAIAMAHCLPGAPGLPWAVKLTLMCGGVAFLGVRARYEAGPARWKRAAAGAWRCLVPRLHDPEFSQSDAAAAAGLAQVSEGVGDPRGRADQLGRVVEATRRAVTGHTAHWAYMVPPRRLQLLDEEAAGKDAVLPLADEVGLCLLGKLPLDYGDALLAGWAERDWWTPTHRARLRVLLCARAFHVGLSAWDVHELGELLPNFGAAIDIADLDSVARLRHLWSRKAGRDWNRVGVASTVFELARFPVLAGSYLGDRPDVLLYQPETAQAGETVLVCGSGVAVGRRLFADPDDPDIDPTLAAWLRYRRDDFLPGVDAEMRRPGSPALAQLLRQRGVSCPDCRLRFVGRAGEVGLRFPETPGG